MEMRESVKTTIKNAILGFIHASIENMPDGWSKGIENKNRIMGCDKITDSLLDAAEHGEYPEASGIRKIISDFGKALQTNPNLTAEEFLSNKDKKSPFSVYISIYKESHQTTYHVTLHNSDIAKENMMDSDEGRIIPFYSQNLEHANIEGQTYADFLGIPFTPYVLTE